MPNPSPTSRKPQIFLSYRREDTAGHAGRLRGDIERKLRGTKVFMDISTINPGEDFEETIKASIASCNLLLALIGRSWLDLMQRNAADPNQEDWVRLEIATAIEKKIPIVPVLVGGGRLPEIKELPPELQPLARRQAFEISDSRWDYDVNKLIKVIKQKIPHPGRRYWWVVACLVAVFLVGIALYVKPWRFLKGTTPQQPASERPVVTLEPAEAPVGRDLTRLRAPCARNLAECPDQGCGSDFDPNLNRRKNIRADDPRAVAVAVPRTLTWMKKLADPEGFEKGGSRDELLQLGEGQKIVVAAYVLAATSELGGESCNCGLHTPAESDNHLILVTKATVDKFPLAKAGTTSKDILHSRELESVTAEFTPRVRLSHPSFTREKVQPMIEAADQQALLVRVTGLLLFDSEHFPRNPLRRITNWEIHPVLKLEVCLTPQKCTDTSDYGWKSLDDL